jgi:GntP family gluconate:H+ symporter
MYTFGVARGFNRTQLLKFSEECLGPAASILLVVGAGGGFNRVLVASGVGDALAAGAKSLQVSPLLAGWLMAAAIRVATGSATVAVTTAAGMIAPIAANAPGTNKELLVLAMGAGSLVLSHVNDGGFWFVKEYFGLTVPQTLQTWTVMETIIGVVGLVLVLLMARVV